MNVAHWRKMTWVLAIWTALWAVFIVIRVVGILSKSCSSDILGAAFSGDNDCVEIAVNGKAEVAIGRGFGLMFLWLIGFAVLGAVWFMTREKKRTCPHCGNEVAKGLTACANCGYDFVLGRNPAHAATAAAAPDATPVAATAAPAPSTAPPAWYDDAERPGHKRWWDGTAWGVRDDDPPAVGWAGQGTAT